MEESKPDLFGRDVFVFPFSIDDKIGIEKSESGY